jgi:hypothetical protein
MLISCLGWLNSAGVMLGKELIEHLLGGFNGINHAKIVTCVGKYSNGSTTHHYHTTQAPVIMMSQNRQDAKDRLRGELDFDVNRRSEAQIQGLARKLNLLGEQMGDVEDMLREAMQRNGGGNPPSAPTS